MPGQVQEKPPAAGPSAAAAIEDDDEPDEWDKRIFSTGCADENAKMTDCYYEKKDWRACAKEASLLSTETSFAVASRHLACLPLRRIQAPARLYATDSATPSTTSTTDDASSAPPPAKPSTSTSSPAPPKYAKPAPKATPKPAIAASVPSSYSDVVYQAKSIAYEDAREDDAAADAVSVDWTRSFYGISARPVTEKQFKVLMQPIEEKDIEVKPDGVVYLPEIKYRRRLNEAFGPMGWGLIPKGEAVVGDTIVTREYALIVDGRFVSQAQGENSYFSADQLPSAVEGCKSNALMRCCKDLGIASELWDPHFIRWFKKNHMEEVWVEHVTTKKKRLQWYRKGDVDVAYPYKISK
ncbi:Mitochondrial genome maintenance protein MGM101 [Trichoderma ghanense]|uniref:Mitochondrial genome maintenance protein MGM101 n=1 Tax=Trichoderma ghanense TaxID=65468 RepID=A0ABY2HIJ1_9HYPO